MMERGYIVRALVNVTMRPQYSNDMIIKIKIKLKHDLVGKA
jgi:hypothetical protein